MNMLVGNLKKGRIRMDKDTLECMKLIKTALLYLYLDVDYESSCKRVLKDSIDNLCKSIKEREEK